MLLAWVMVLGLLAVASFPLVVVVWVNMLAVMVVLAWVMVLGLLAVASFSLVVVVWVNMLAVMVVLTDPLHHL